jgi:uncharacterized protein YkwD
MPRVVTVTIGFFVLLAGFTAVSCGGDDGQQATPTPTSGDVRPLSGKRPEQKQMPFGVLRWKIPQLTLVFSLLVVIAVTASTGLLSPKPAEALDSEEQAFLATINDYRAQNGPGPLSENSTLDNDARWMANDMATNNYFSHQDSLGRDPFARMDAMGYGYNTWRGENLVAGTETAAYSFQMWHDSPEHNANMLGSHYTVIGIARAYSATSTFGWYWATEFGGVDDSAPPPPPAPTAAPEPAAPPQVVEPVITPVPPPATPEPTATSAPARRQLHRSIRLTPD